MADGTLGKLLAEALLQQSAKSKQRNSRVTCQDEKGRIIFIDIQSKLYHHCERGYQLFVYLHSADTPKFIRICIDFSWQFDQWPGEMVDFADYVIGYRGMLVRLVDDPCEQYSFIEIMDVEGGAQ